MSADAVTSQGKGSRAQRGGAPGVGTPSGGPGDREAVLGRVAIALNSSLELDEVLDVLAREVLTHTGARRASVLLCPEDEPRSDEPGSGEAGAGPLQESLRLVPAVALAREADVELWEAFRTAGAIELDVDQRRAFARARALTLVDAARSDLLPAGWAERFGLESLVLVPLFAAGVPCGLLAVDYPRGCFDSDEIALLESLGEHVGVAVGNARLFERARRRALIGQVLTRSAGGLRAPAGEQEAAGRLADATAELLETDLVCVVRLAGDEVVPLAITGGRPLPRARWLREVPAHLVERLHAAGTRAHGRPCLLEADPWLGDLLATTGVERMTGYVLLPLPAQGQLVGVAMAARHRPGPLPTDVAEAAGALSLLGAAALAGDEVSARPGRRAGPQRPMSRAPRRGRPRGSQTRLSLDNGEHLTPREHEVLTLLAQGLTNGEIAVQLYVSPDTVKSHVSHLLGKLQVPNRRHAARTAQQRGLI